MIPVDSDVVQISFSKPFVYAPVSDEFPRDVVNENLGYVPQTLIDWMAQDSDYVSKFPGIASCLPGGPSVDFYNYFCRSREGGIPHDNAVGFGQVHVRETDLTTSLTYTVTGEGCFHPGSCPTAAAPSSTAVAATPEVTGAERLQNTGASKTAPTRDRTFGLCHL